MLKFILNIAFIFLICFKSNAAEVIILNDSTEDVILTNHHYQLFEDTAQTFSIEQVSSSEINQKFRISTLDYNYAQNPDAAYWIRFKVKDLSSEKKKWVLELLSLHTQDLQFFVPDGKGGFHVKQAGQNFNFFKREYAVTNFVFDLPSDLNKETVFYVRIVSKHPVGFEFKIRSQNYFTYYTVNEYYFLGFYYGILFIMAIYNLLLFISSKEKVYIFYVLYVISCMLNSLAEDGLGFQFVWPGFPEWNWVINNYIWSGLFLLTFVFYSTSFLELKKNFIKLYYTVFIVAGLYFVSFFLDITFDLFDIFFLPILTVYGIAIYVLLKGYKPGRFFVLGFTFVFISIIIYQLRIYNIVEHNIFTVYSFNYGIVLEVVVLSFALGDRIKIMKAEKEKAQMILIDQLEENQMLQTKVNKELEEKVAIRTNELVQKSNELTKANEKLQTLTDELNKFASKLDLDNWELNKKVIEETKARMLSKEVSFQEFNKIFPSEFACLKYIEEIKWGEGYICKKCSNVKYTARPKLLSRKCSKCNYIESVTSSTIFHAVKFPINKAFYITYITSIKNNKITVDELAETLQLNRLTCWKFRKKVLAKESEILKTFKLKKIDNWELLLKD